MNKSDVYPDTILYLNGIGIFWDGKNDYKEFKGRKRMGILGGRRCTQICLKRNSHIFNEDEVRFYEMTLTFTKVPCIDRNANKNTTNIENGRLFSQ